MKEHLTPKQLAQALGVSEASIKRWCDRDRIPTTRTAGGHRRIPVSGAIAYVRQSGRPLPHPEVLGLPPISGRGTREVRRAAREIQEALEVGDEESVRSLALNLYLAGRSCVEICDRCVAAAFHEIGLRWEHAELSVYRERRACEITLRLIRELRTVLPPFPPGAPAAMGGTLPADPYALPTAMVELVLREKGWEATSCGVGLPADTLRVAVEENDLRLLWLSVSAIDSEDGFLREYEKIFDAASLHGTVVAVGGRRLTEGLRREMRYAAYCDTLEHLVSFVDTLDSTPPTGSAAS